MAAKKTVTKARVSTAIATTPVRNTTIPPRPASPLTGARKTPVTYDQIARRAYEIWQSGTGGSQEDNWFRAERELRGA